MGTIPPDLLWKGIIEDLAEDFVKFFFPDWSKSIDFSREFEFLDKELAQLSAEAAETRRVVDKLIKVFLKDGTEKWVLIHVEVQGYKDPDFAKRLFTYYYRLLDRYGVPITTLAILTDNHPNFHPTTYETRLAGTALLFRFNTYKLLDHTLEAFRMVDNPFARVMEVARIALERKKLAEEHLYSLTIGVVRRLKNSGYSSNATRKIMNFLGIYVRFKNQVIIRNFEKDIDQIFENSFTMGLEEMILEETKKQIKQEGLEEGKLKEKQQVVYHSWQEGLSPELTAKLTELPVEQVKKLFAQFTAGEKL